MTLNFYARVKDEEVAGAMKRLQAALGNNPIAAWPETSQVAPKNAPKLKLRQPVTH
jgi:hypothetical protein